jgi:DNA invertase Pin-like site-specific DNA recombinase
VKTDRPELAKVVRCLEAGDVLMVTRLDRLARDLLNILDAVGKTGAAFKSLSDAWADTTTPHGRLMLTVLGGLAEFERELILARTGDGRARAKARGVRRGATVRLPSLLSACLCEPTGIGTSARAREITKDPNAAGRKPEHA